MEWIAFLIILVLASAFAFGYGVAQAEKLAARNHKWELAKVYSDQAHDRMGLLYTLRRELANYLIWQDPDRYFRLYQLIHTETSSFKDLDPAKRQERLTTLCNKYKRYQDFDTIGTRVYVLYADRLSIECLEDVEANYRDIVTFQALMIASDDDWKPFHATSEAELKHLL
jgi:hypothetical protein